MIIHTGDFKIDDAPVDGERFDTARFAELGEAGVRLLLSDSTNVERRGRTESESSLKPILRELMRKTTGKFLLSGFSSHLHRFRQFAEVCHEQGRRVAVLGRRIAETTRVGIALGHLPFPPGTFIDEREISSHADDKVGFLTGGSQAEPMSAMVRIAAAAHPRLRLSKGDVVVLSSRFIPGNERLIHRLINDLYRLGAEVFYEGVAPVHVSGHASRDELAEMIRLTRPEYFVPIHGEYRHLKRHIDVAVECGVRRARMLSAAGRRAAANRSATAPIAAPRWKVAGLCGTVRRWKRSRCCMNGRRWRARARSRRWSWWTGAAAKSWPART